MAGRQHITGSHDVDRELMNGPDSPVTALPFGPTTASVNVVGQEGILMGYALIETTGTAAAAVDFVDGADDTGTVLVPVSLSAGQSTRDTFSSWGVWIQRGLRVKVSSGSVRGVAYVILPGRNAGR